MKRVLKSAERLGLGVQAGKVQGFWTFMFSEGGKQLTAFPVRHAPAALEWLNAYGIGYRIGHEKATQEGKAFQSSVGGTK